VYSVKGYFLNTLFYKELDIPLFEIKQLIEEDSNRIATLEKQKKLFETKN
jgi:hypothetical protein